MNALRLISRVNSAFCGAKSLRLSQPVKVSIIRLYSQEGRGSVWRTVHTRRKNFSEAISRPGGETGASDEKL